MADQDNTLLTRMKQQQVPPSIAPMWEEAQRTLREVEAHIILAQQSNHRTLDLDYLRKAIAVGVKGGEG